MLAIKHGVCQLDMSARAEPRNAADANRSTFSKKVTAATASVCNSSRSSDSNSAGESNQGDSRMMDNRSKLTSHVQNAVRAGSCLGKHPLARGDKSPSMARRLQPAVPQVTPEDEPNLPSDSLPLYRGQVGEQELDRRTADNTTDTLARADGRRQLAIPRATRSTHSRYTAGRGQEENSPA